jgi:hypothetical protein
LILPGQLILLAFLVEKIFLKPAMSLFSTQIRHFYFFPLLSIDTTIKLSYLPSKEEHTEQV